MLPADVGGFFDAPFKPLMFIINKSLRNCCVFSLVTKIIRSKLLYMPFSFSLKKGETGVSSELIWVPLNQSGWFHTLWSNIQALLYFDQLTTLWGHFEAPYFKMHNDASVAPSGSSLRTCSRIRNSKKIASIRDFHLSICINPTVLSEAASFI